MSDQSANSIKPAESEAASQNGVAYRLLSFGSTIVFLGGTWFFTAAIISTIYNFVFSDLHQGSWLFLAVLPLWIFGAACFDKCRGAVGDEDEAR